MSCGTISCGENFVTPPILLQGHQTWEFSPLLGVHREREVPRIPPPPVLVPRQVLFCWRSAKRDVLGASMPQHTITGAFLTCLARLFFLCMAVSSRRMISEMLHMRGSLKDGRLKTETDCFQTEMSPGNGEHCSRKCLARL